MSKHSARSSRYIKRRASWLAAQPPFCWLCGAAVDIDGPRGARWSATVDHVVPVSRGGDAEDPANWRVACHRCNSRRGNRWPSDMFGVRLPQAW